MRIVPVAALICSALLLQGCIGAALVGSAAVATKAATDPVLSAHRSMTVHSKHVSAASSIRIKISNSSGLFRWLIREKFC